MIQLELQCTVASHVNLAFHQNSIPFIDEIKLDNKSDQSLSDLVVDLICEPAVISPLRIRIERVQAGGIHYVRTPDVRLDPGLLRSLVEGVKAELSVVVGNHGAEIARKVMAVQLLPASHWGGVGAAPELLAAFVRPNDPAVDVLLHEASQKLDAAGKPRGVDGYSAGSKGRAWDLASAIWSAIAAQRITYVLPPASFERSGQKVRSPSDILARKTATCLDTTLLYAACLEQAGLDPLVVLTEGHAFVGLWLQKADIAQVLVDDAQTLRKRRDLQEMVLIETTMLTHNPPARFAAAVAQGASQIEEDAAARLEAAIDVRRARMRQIRPLDLGDAVGSASIRAPDSTPIELGLDDAPPFVDEVVSKHEPDQPADRLERWKRKLLDLTLRNKLLNFKDAKKAVPIDCPDAAKLEDLLASGQKFRFLPRAELLDASDGRSAQLYQERYHDDGRRQLIIQALERGDLHTTLTEIELDARLTELSRLTKTAFEEGGSNILFLALGFLSWTQKDGAKPSRAPVLLVPVSLQRSSARSGYRMVLHEEEALFNPTLIEMLRQDFDMRMPEFERDLPTDSSGMAVAQIWQGLRSHVRDLKGWEVTGDVALSTFSFTKFLMWKDLVERIDQLKQNPVVRHLIDTPKHTYGDGSPFPEPERIDRDHHPREIFAPLSADSSQLAAVMAAAKGKDFVLFGPPGTGKSQTIANMIAQCLASNKTVLFVSQKTAALEVVQRRLRDIGLGPYCLEVHSTKAQKSAVLGQLKAAWHDHQSPAADDWEIATTKLGALRDELNALVSALHRRHGNGMSAYEAFGCVVANRNRVPSLRLEWPDAAAHTPAIRERMRALCRDLETALKAIGSPSDHPLRGIATRGWTPAWRNEMTSAIETHAAIVPRLAEAAANFAATVGLESLPCDLVAIQALASFGSWLLQPEATLGSLLLGPNSAARKQAQASLTALQQRAAPLRDRLTGKYRDTVFQIDLRAKLDDWAQASASNFLTRGGRQRRVVEGLKPYVDGPLPDDVGSDLSVLIELGGLRGATDKLTEQLEVFGPHWRGLDTDAGALAGLAAWAERGQRELGTFARLIAFDEHTLRDHVIMLVTAYAHLFEEGGPGPEAHAALALSLQEAETAIERLSTAAGRAESVPLSQGEDWIAGSLAVAERWKANLNRSQQWCFWNRTAHGVCEAGLRPVVESIESGEILSNEVELAFDAAYARWWADLVVTEDAVLSSFLAERHDNTINGFRRADEAVGSLARQIVRARLRGDVPSPSRFGSDPEWGTLNHEIVKKARHLPLRQLFSRLPTALTKLTPCLMMSPLSIAQYLPASSQPFDVVIFDEASQIPVWDAIGAIARGKQVVVVGDPEQLPPTSVGERGVDDVEDGTDVDDQESILDECLASNIPARRLEWHYRSRNESLIAFSNRSYYGNRLVTFPSSETDDRAVHLVPVPQGVYQRGKDRTNLKEANAVVADVIRRLEDPRFAAERLSLGVVTFNGQQQRLIENLLQEKLKQKAGLERFFDAAQWHEPVFVKNLENVQGDERDVILFSVTFAPDETGRPVSTVSSLNKDGGHRRLNVAITRARREMAIFATLRADQIALTGQGSRGIRDFKHFLEFAERGPKALAEANSPTGRGTDSPFEDAVMDALVAKGWIVHPQVGVSSFRIDLAIVHPDAPGRYLAGVECDGATYHRSATARDRDRLRENVLVGLGWRIRRVWSTEWWMDAVSAFEKLHARLNVDLEEDRSKPVVKPERLGPVEDGFPSIAAATEDDAIAAPEPAIEEFVPPASAPTDPLPPLDKVAAAPVYARSAEVQRPATAAPQGYRQADLGAYSVTADPARFNDLAYRPSLRIMVARVIAVEGPIFDDVLITRIARAHGFGRAGGRIRDAVLAAVAPEVALTKEGDRTIYWPVGADPNQAVSFRPAAAEVRDHGDVPLPELADLAASLRPTHTSDEEVIRAMAARLGIARLRESTRARFHSAVLSGCEIARNSDPLRGGFRARS